MPEHEDEESALAPPPPPPPPPLLLPPPQPAATSESAAIASPPTIQRFLNSSSSLVLHRTCIAIFRSAPDIAAEMPEVSAQCGHFCKQERVYTVPAPKWRNWQTRRTQNPVPARACGFDPH